GSGARRNAHRREGRVMLTAMISSTFKLMSSARITSYRDLRVWQYAMGLVEATYRASDQFPTAERYGLVSQMRRAAVSIASNIAEGHARSIGDYTRHLL